MSTMPILKSCVTGVPFSELRDEILSQLQAQPLLGGTECLLHQIETGAQADLTSSMDAQAAFLEAEGFLAGLRGATIWEVSPSLRRIWEHPRITQAEAFLGKVQVSSEYYPTTFVGGALTQMEAFMKRASLFFDERDYPG